MQGVAGLHPSLIKKRTGNSLLLFPFSIQQNSTCCPKLVQCLTSISKYKPTREGDTFKTKKCLSFIYIIKIQQVIKLNEDYLYNDRFSCQLCGQSVYIFYTLLNIHIPKDCIFIIILAFMLQKLKSKGLKIVFFFFFLGYF